MLGVLGMLHAFMRAHRSPPCHDRRTIAEPFGQRKSASGWQGVHDVTGICRARSRPADARCVDLQQPLGVDAGVDLRGRERGVAEQFLDRAQVAAARQQMRGEGMPQRVRRRAVGQPQRAAQPLHRELDDARAERPAARADEDRPVRRRADAGTPRCNRAISASTFCSTGTIRVLLPLPVTTSTSPSPGSGTSRLFRPSASEMRRPEP